jgi:hypothetical protein
MSLPDSFFQLAHIGNVPVEEWLPFVVPIVVLYFAGMRRERQRRGEVRAMPGTSRGLDAGLVSRIVAGWREAGYEDVAVEHLPLLYPPGPDGYSVAELAERTACDEATVERTLEILERGEYLQLDPETVSGGVEATLTSKGVGLVDATEDLVLTAMREAAVSRTGAPSRARRP